MVPPRRVLKHWGGGWGEEKALQMEGLCKVQKAGYAWEPELGSPHPSSLIRPDPEVSKGITDGPNQSVMPNIDHYQGLESPKKEDSGHVWENISRLTEGERPTL